MIACTPYEGLNCREPGHWLVSWECFCRFEDERAACVTHAKLLMNPDEWPRCDWCGLAVWTMTVQALSDLCRVCLACHSAAMTRWEPWLLADDCPICESHDLHLEPAVRLVACHTCGHLYFDPFFWAEGNPYE